MTFFAILTSFVKILTSNAYKKKFAYFFIILLYELKKKLYGILYYIFENVDPRIVICQQLCNKKLKTIENLSWL